MATLTLRMERAPTPLGEMLIVTDEQGLLRALNWGDHESDMLRLMRNHYRKDAVQLQEIRRASPAMQAMLAYFEGDLAGIDHLPVLTGGTDFQRQVWAALREIACGSTISYLDLATRIGKPAAVRAVGMANHANPISIVIPCHRVIGSDRTLTGYGGGLHRKRWLLEHESEYRQGRLI
ncbi:methylated-DNA--[protein]-cysteine S-methyltransferase [Bordetella sp. FB-8]|uniref:methylated-DNA--[protein]-cysteine S-methyltransferase n=1 Tax=Bordetella sp. FB-8 TaxID=1159870 RepID=UPI0003A19B7C|nr:methylated-DNA--[protein]-cysteine S-methyltransferase [Bordetella sp. FB-8]